MKPPKPSPEELRAILLRDLHYNPDNGELRWKDGVRGPTGRIRRNPAGSKGPNGYLNLKIGAYFYYVHRLVWLMIYGKFPEFIDHRDRVKLNNRLSNLREASRLENARNRDTYRRKTDLPMGVQEINGRFTAKIGVNYKTLHLGRFDTVESAQKAYLEARQRIYGDFDPSQIKEEEKPASLVSQDLPQTVCFEVVAEEPSAG